MERIDCLSYINQKFPIVVRLFYLRSCSPNLRFPNQFAQVHHGRSEKLIRQVIWLYRAWRYGMWDGKEFKGQDTGKFDVICLRGRR